VISFHHPNLTTYKLWLSVRDGHFKCGGWVSIPKHTSLGRIQRRS